MVNCFHTLAPPPQSAIQAKALRRMGDNGVKASDELSLAAPLAGVIELQPQELHVLTYYKVWYSGLFRSVSRRDFEPATRHIPSKKTHVPVRTLCYLAKGATSKQGERRGSETSIFPSMTPKCCTISPLAVSQKPRPGQQDPLRRSSQNKVESDPSCTPPPAGSSQPPVIQATAFSFPPRVSSYL